MSDRLLYVCRVCGVDVDSYPIITNERGEEVAIQGVCEKCCEYHEYIYDVFERRHMCKHCGAYASYDWYYP